MTTEVLVRASHEPTARNGVASEADQNFRDDFGQVTKKLDECVFPLGSRARLFGIIAGLTSIGESHLLKIDWEVRQLEIIGYADKRNGSRQAGFRYSKDEAFAFSALVCVVGNEFRGKGYVNVSWEDIVNQTRALLEEPHLREIINEPNDPSAKLVFGRKNPDIGGGDKDSDSRQRSVFKDIDENSLAWGLNSGDLTKIFEELPPSYNGVKSGSFEPGFVDMIVIIFSALARKSGIDGGISSVSVDTYDITEVQFKTMIKFVAGCMIKHPQIGTLGDFYSGLREGRIQLIAK